MKFLLMIYTDDTLFDAVPEAEANTMMHDCFMHADALRERGELLDSQQLEEPAAAKSVRLREQRLSVMDGPFAETKEYLAGFNVIEARDMAEAIRIASEFPWTRTGCIEIRPLRDLGAVRQRVGALRG
jgi:hypothetical protein